MQVKTPVGCQNVRGSIRAVYSLNGTKMNTSEFKGRSSRRRQRAKVAIVLRGLLVLVGSVLLLALPCSGSSKQEQQKAAVGSLTSTGEVFVNNTAAPADATIFPGDTLRTGDGNATFTMSGRGDLKISRQTQLVFSDGSQYTAELKSGTVVIDSSNGPAGVTLFAGGYVVVPAVQGQITAAKVDGLTNGSFRVAALSGAVAILDMQGNSGRVLQSGESVSLSPQGISASTAAPASSGHQKRWILLGVVGGGAAAGIAAGVAHGSKQTVSPSSP